MSEETRLEAAIREYEKDVDFLLDGVLMQFNEAIVREMKAGGITRSELARRLGTSKAYITRLLAGNANPTLRSLVRLSLVLGVTPTVALRSAWDQQYPVGAAGIRGTSRGTLIPLPRTTLPAAAASDVCGRVRFKPDTRVVAERPSQVQSYYA